MIRAAFRVDASLQIGAGHVMRCLTLAEKLREDGFDCLFICREHPGNLISEIAQRGFLVFGLPIIHSSENIDLFSMCDPHDYSEWLGVSVSNEISDTKAILSSRRIDWLVVDHYALDIRWEAEMRYVCSKIIAIDDLANRTHDCDILLDQNLNRQNSDYINYVNPSCRILTGSKYALIRTEFGDLRAESLNRRSVSRIEHLLITMGGVDRTNLTRLTLEALGNSVLPKDLLVTVIMGWHSPWLADICSLSERMEMNIRVESKVNNMAYLMANSDVAIGGGGATSWERCCLGLPSIICIQAENQEHIARAIDSAGAGKIFNPKEGVTAMVNLISEVFCDVKGLRKMSLAAAAIIDGLGTMRVVNEMLEKQVN